MPASSPSSLVLAGSYQLAQTLAPCCQSLDPDPGLRVRDSARLVGAKVGGQTEKLAGSLMLCIPLKAAHPALLKASSSDEYLLFPPSNLQSPVAVSSLQSALQSVVVSRLQSPVSTPGSRLSTSHPSSAALPPLRPSLSPSTGPPSSLRSSFLSARPPAARRPTTKADQTRPG
ncbi:hypothetical protein BJ875DRAFT_444681 [Amylocarpus encephaloides]|uniref:Uncharacterized protein n=1 Tax=Amylocarpus encephaloides TaxID=45428 RepID=A0A9P7YCG6_9HELO|nr:hypothetical protein BJ875DRAFT_444681 [Amylocarpus encephaloides]